MNYQINYAGGVVAAQVFSTAKAMNDELDAIKDYRGIWDEIRDELTRAGLPFRAGFRAFCPYIQYFRLVAVRPEDGDGIPENDIYLDFCVNMKERKIEAHTCGHIWLTKEDQEASNLCMCSVKQAVKTSGRKWFIKRPYKTPVELAGKVADFWKSTIMPTLEDSTTGYPYKQMKVNIY